jgi:hypothetical protein
MESEEKNTGWLKLYRDLLYSPIFSSEKGLKIWIWCLLKASHKETDIYVGLTKIQLSPGQFVFGRESASRELKIRPSTIQDYIQLLKSDSYIDIKPTTKYSVITILNWSAYQESDSKTVNKATTKQQQSNTNKNVKNDKNKEKEMYKEKEKPENSLAYLTAIPQLDVDQFLKDYKVTAYDVYKKGRDFSNYCLAKGKTYRNYKAALRNALAKDFGERFQPLPVTKKESLADLVERAQHGKSN